MYIPVLLAVILTIKSAITWAKNVVYFWCKINVLTQDKLRNSLDNAIAFIFIACINMFQQLCSNDNVFLTTKLSQFFQSNFISTKVSTVKRA
jgi:hypothetical protein